MHALIENNAVKQYPYSVGDLKRANPDTSFPSTVSDEALQEYGVQRVFFSTQPTLTDTQVLEEQTPVFSAEDQRWTQVWSVRDKTAEELQAEAAARSAQVEAQRSEAYRNESDPLFFKSQRGEATHQEWLDKVAEIKARYPNP